MKKKEQTMKIKIHEATLNQNLVGDEIICSIIKPMKPIPPDPFVRQSQLDKALKDVVRRSDLDEALKPYVTKADLKEALKPFVTRDELKAELAKKPAWFDTAMTEALAPIIKRLDQNGLKPLQE